MWAVVLPLMLAGTEVAHALAYRIVYPIASVRWHVLATSGHGYMGYAPLVFGIASAVMLAGFASMVVDIARRRPSRPLPAWAFALLPILGFTVQEFTERLLATDSLPWWMFEQPTFRVGVLLQLPFALSGYLIARFLLRAAERVAEVFTGSPRPVFVGWFAGVFSVRVSLLVKRALLWASVLGRGPPEHVSVPRQLQAAAVGF